MIYKLLMILLFLHVSIATAAAKQNADSISLDLQNVSTQDALHIMAKFLHQNIVISSQVSGTTSLHLHDMSKQDIFDLLLASDGLVKQKIGHTWFIASRAEFFQRQQEELKIQMTWDDTAPLITRVWQIRYAKSGRYWSCVAR